MTLTEKITIGLSLIAILLSLFTFFKSIFDRKKDDERYLRSHKSTVLKECDSLITELNMLILQTGLLCFSEIPAKTKNIINSHQMKIEESIRLIENIRESIATMDYKSLDKINDLRDKFNKSREVVNLGLLQIEILNKN